ncbi:hypothetical protein ACFOWM_01390 [Ferruginibacter yonginensis]|uniref:Uncharacterized protein n=1 Tax=Ferruginibacter yonginensis TaxID=1310416 RepID=A0ABV8QP93_9BACT
MNNLFKGLIAGYGAKKLGGGCFSTILIFIIIYWALGTCNKEKAPAPQTTGYVYIQSNSML